MAVVDLASPVEQLGDRGPLMLEQPVHGAPASKQVREPTSSSARSRQPAARSLFSRSNSTCAASNSD